MVDYIGTAGIQRLLKRVGIAAFISGLADEIEADYRRWSEFDKSPRHAIHSPGGVIELMPTSDGQLYSFKYVNGHPQNTAQGLLTVTGFGVLADVATGYPLLLAELTVTTALRTAATSVMAARRLARPGSQVMALIGNGAQSEFQALAFAHVLGIRTLRLYDVDDAATDKLVRNLEAQAQQSGTPWHITRCRNAAEAAQGADIVTTVTADKRYATIVTPDMVAPGMHLNAVGGDCPGKTELHADIFKRPDVRVFVEYEPQSRIEGEIQQLAPDYAVTEWAQVLLGHAPGRTSDAQVTVFDSVGFALEDYSALNYLYKLQAPLTTRAQIDLIPQLLDPKDLFSVLAPAPAEPATSPTAAECAA